MKRGRRIWHGFAFVAIFAAGIAIVMLLWNALIPSIIGWTAINYWQAAGLMVLCRLLFGGLGHKTFHRHHGHMPPQHLHEKLRGMSMGERREYIRKRMWEGFEEQEEKKKESPESEFKERE